MIQEKVCSYEQIHGPVCHDRGIRGYGSPARQSVFLLGIAPGATEIAQGRPFIGPAGKLLDGVLKGVGWPRERCYATNIYCMHKDHPEPEEIALCAPRLQFEVSVLDPRLIVLFGDIVCTAFLPEVKLSEVRGHVLRRGGRYVLPTYHPAAVLHGGTGIINDIVRDLDKIKDIMTWPHPDDHSFDPHIHLVSNIYEAQRIVNNLPSDCPVAIDIETQKGEESEEQIDIFSDRLRSVAVSDGTSAWAFTAEIARDIHWRSDVRWTMHNGMFDAQGIRKFLNVHLPIVHDTMLASYCLDERPGRHGLKKLAAEYLGIADYAINTANLADESDEAVLTYNALDAAYTARLASIFVRKMHADDVYKPYAEILIPAANAFTDISYRGVNIDQKKLEQLGDEWFPRYVRQSQEMMDRATDLGFQKKIKSKTKKSSVEQHLFDAYNWAPHAEAINLRSPKQLAFLLFDVLGLTPPVFTKKTGAPSTNKVALEMLEGQHEFVDMLVAFRKLNQVLQSYILGVRDDIREDGRLHPNVLLHGTRTGRLSYRKPPLQTMPRDYSVGDDLARVTEIIIPDNDDRVILGADYEKAEVWCLVPTTRILYDDLTWRQIGSAEPGDWIVGFDEELKSHYHHRHMRRSRIVDVRRYRKPVVRVEFDTGTVITCTPEHKWLTENARSLEKDSQPFQRVGWVQTHNLKVGSRVKRLVAPWETDNSRSAGYLAGVFDGEGYLHAPGGERAGYRIGFTQKEGEVLDLTNDLLQSKGYSPKPQKTRSNGVSITTLNGLENCLRFLGQIRPHRLLASSRKLWEDKSASHTGWATVRSIETWGEEEVVDIETTTHTFIAEGLFTHNCAAYLSGDPQMMSDLRGGDYHRMVAAAAFGKPASMVTKAERQEAKKITFGILYGSGADGLAVSMRTDVMTAEKYLTRFRHRYHVYNDWYEKSRRAAVKEGELQSLTGRKRRFYLVMGADAHKALNQSVNTPVQGLANDVCLDSLVKLHYLLRPFKAYVMLSLHDGIYFDTPRDNLAAVADLVKATMEAPHFGVEIPVELKYGPSLGQLTEMKV